MRSVNWKIFSITLLLAAGYLATVIKAQQPASATVYEGARLIIGDGSAPLRIQHSSSKTGGSPRLAEKDRSKLRQERPM